jgi:outer membrane biosynthesis protein TonB
MGKPRKLQRPKVFRHFVYAVGLLAGLVPGLTHAQTSIDAGKSPGEIFQTVCTTCHKSARGLANGRGSSGLASFLAEHYTSGKDQAAQLAAYVMGAGGGEAAPAAQGRKPTPDNSRTATEESKPSPQRQKPDSSGANAKLQPPVTEEPKQRPGDVPSIVQERGRKPAPGRRDEPATASRGKPVPEPEAKQAPPEPAHAAAEPPKPTVQESAPGAAAAAPANADAGESAPVPRDNIPD